VETHLSSRSYKPSRILADFYFQNAHRGSDDALRVPPAHVGLLYDALLAGESERVAVRATLEGDVDQDNAEAGEENIAGEFELVDPTTLDNEEPRISSLEFTVTAKPHDALHFRRYLRDASISVSCRVELGCGDGEFEIGPSVTIRAGGLRLLTPSLIVGGKTKVRKLGEQIDNSVVLEALDADSSVVERPVTHVGLSVTWPGCEAFPWTGFASMPDTGILKDPRLGRAFIRFRRIVMTLRSHSKGSLARVRHKIEHARVLQGPIGEALLAKLLSDGVITLRGNFYHLVPTNADQHTGTSWMELRR
jgi:hypothetical protein